VKRQQTGRLAESLARGFLEQAGYHIIDTNWRCVEGEIDIVCRDGDQTVFVEVRAKSSAEFGTPAESIGHRKQARLIAAAETYCAEHAISENWRIDFIGIEFRYGGHRTEHIKYAVSGRE
jgi:putative endonuclease